MKRYETQDIRNVVFVGHGGSGKTSLASLTYISSAEGRSTFSLSSTSGQTTYA